MGLNRLEHEFSAEDLAQAPDTLALFGIQGSGKGTQAKRLIKHGGYAYIEMGAMLRDNNQRIVRTDRGEETIDAIQKRGDLVPTPDVMEMAQEKIDGAVSSGTQRILFDGLPRAEDQARALNIKLAELGRLDAARMVHIKVSDETARMSIRFRAAIEGRPDDAQEATVDRRINGFHAKTMPVIRLYDAMGKVLEVNGETGIDLARPTVVAARLKELRAIPYAQLNGEAAELQDLEAEWNEDVQPQLDASIDEVYMRILQAINANRRADGSADVPHYTPGRSPQAVLMGVQQ